MIKKIIAKEWLLLLGSILFGITCIFILCIALGTTEELIEAFCKLEIEAYFFVLSPYFLLQFVRSVIWAIKVLKKSKSE
ncbi:MAG: hypothetical protein HY919_02610 [Elusimicrobia bacterium]|nr:hypothetical protein [Elusimicrobiota bacterium]